MLQRQSKDIEFQRMSFLLPKDLYKFLKAESKERGISMTLYLAEVLREKRRKKENEVNNEMEKR